MPGVPLPEATDRVNARPSDAVLRLQRFVNDSLGEASRETSWGRLIYDATGRAAGKLDGWTRGLTGSPLAPLAPEAAHPEIHEAYAAENRRLAELIERPIRDHGYPL